MLLLTDDYCTKKDNFVFGNEPYIVVLAIGNIEITLLNYLL